MTETTTLAVATQQQMLLCWSEGVMGTRGLPSYMDSTLRNHPIPRGIVDALFHSSDDKPNNGWHRARTTRSVSAIVSMRSWLKARNLCAQPEVEQAWDRTLRRDKCVATLMSEVRFTVEQQAWGEPDVETTEDFIDYLVRGLENFREQLR